MSKILKNTTTSNIEIFNLGITIFALDQVTITTDEFLLLASEDVVSELTPLINSGDIVVNDGINDLLAEKGIEYIQFPNFAESIRFLSNPEKNNGFLAKDVQEAIEEAKLNSSTFNGFNAGEFLTPRLLYAYNSSGSQLITSSPSTIIINTIDSVSDNNQYLLSSGELEFKYADKCTINYSVTFTNTNGARTNTQSFLEINKGLGFNKILGSDVYTYERTSGNDVQTGSKTIFTDVNIGDIIRIRSQILNGSDNNVQVQGCSFSVVPRRPPSEEPILTIDGSDLTQTEILGEINSGEL